MSHAFFFLGFALLLVHEMDAVRLGEWRIFPSSEASGTRRGTWRSRPCTFRSTRSY